MKLEKAPGQWKSSFDCSLQSVVSWNYEFLITTCYLIFLIFYIRHLNLTSRVRTTLRRFDA